MNFLSEYRRIMSEEFKLKYKEVGGMLMMESLCFDVEEISGLLYRIRQTLKLSLLPRSYISRYGLSAEEIAHESVGAHTNLVMDLISEALSYWYGPDFGRPGGNWLETVDGFSLAEIMTAVLIHDKAECEIGDIPDNGGFDPKEKAALEEEYYYEYFATYPPRCEDFKRRVWELLRKMSDPYSETGRLLHVADKAAAILITLAYDEAGHPPMRSIDSSGLSERDKEEMLMCDFSENGYRKASEMWTIDHFHIRKFSNLDDTGFFTALIVMYTLEVNGRWYDWREKDYI